MVCTGMHNNFDGKKAQCLTEISTFIADDTNKPEKQERQNKSPENMSINYRPHYFNIL